MGGWQLVKGLSPDPFSPKCSFSLPTRVGEASTAGQSCFREGSGPQGWQPGCPEPTFSGAPALAPCLD